MSLRDKVKTRTTIDSIELSADDWELFTGDDEMAVKSARAAEQLNRTFQFAVNSGYIPARTYSIMLSKQDELSYMGASDTEPRAVLRWLMSVAYGDDWELRL